MSAAPSQTLLDAASFKRDLQELRIMEDNKLYAMTRKFARVATNAEIAPEVQEEFNRLALGTTLRDSDKISAIKRAENLHVKTIESEVMMSPFRDFIDARKGIGYLTFGRLWALLGDPSIHPDTSDLAGQPRLISQVHSYCGVGDPSKERSKGNQYKVNTKCGPALYNAIFGASQRSQDGFYKPLYLAEKAKFQGHLHTGPCAQCGTKSAKAKAKEKEFKAGGVAITVKNDVQAEEGTPWKPGHINGHALRKVKRQFLTDIVLEAYRINDMQYMQFQL